MINQSTIILTIILALMTLVLSKRYLLVPFIIAMCFIPIDQRIIVAGLDFTPLRLLIIATILRVYLRSEQREIKWNIFDKMVFTWAICGAAIYIIQWASMMAFINRSGVLFDILGVYWIFRHNIRSWEEFDFVLKVFAISALITVVLVLYERATHYNPFILLGRVGTGIHRGRYRCMSSFRHAINLGLFWTALFPIFFSYAITRRPKVLFWWPVVASCVIIVFATGSSTPLVVLLWVVILLLAFRIRHYGKVMVMGFFSAILALHLIKDQPVWHLIGQARIIKGSTSWHRYRLINAAIEHFHEWVLLGTRNPGAWGYGLYDVTNEYIREGVNGGFLALALLITLMVMGIWMCGKYSLMNIPKREQWLGWAFCVALLGHCVGFLGTSYWGKPPIILYMTFAIVGMITGKLQRAFSDRLALLNYSSERYSRRRVVF